MKEFPSPTGKLGFFQTEFAVDAGLSAVYGFSVEEKEPADGALFAQHDSAGHVGAFLFGEFEAQLQVGEERSYRLIHDGCEVRLIGGIHYFPP